MTEAKYEQLKKRYEWLYVILEYCQGSEVPTPVLAKAVKAAKHFQADLISKIVRYENKQKDVY